MNLNKRFISAGIIALLIISALAIVLNYQSTKSKAVQALELSVFTVEDFNIVNDNSTHVHLWFQISFETNLSTSLQGIQIQQITFDLLQKSVVVATFVYTPTSTSISSPIEQDVFLSIDQMTSVASNLVENMMLHHTASALPFRATVSYTFLGAHDSLSFKNKLIFATQRQIAFSLDRISLPPINTTSTNIRLNISNPFTTNFSIGGSADVYFDDFLAGTVNISQQLVLVPGIHQYTLSGEINNSLEFIVSRLLAEGFTNTTLTSHLYWNLYNHSISFSGSIPLESTVAGGLIFSVPIIHAFVVNISSVSTLDFDLLVENHLPIDINVTAFHMTASLVSGKHIGSLTWNGTMIPLPAFQSAVFAHAYGVFNITDTDLLRIGFDGGISIPDAVLVANNRGFEQQIHFSIEFLELKL